MAPLTLANVYICSNVLLALAAALLEALRAVSPRLQYPIAHRHQLRWGQTLALAAVLLPLASSLSKSSSFLPQTAQVWSVPTLRSGTFAALEHQRIALSFGASTASMPIDVVGQVVTVLFVSGLVSVLLRLAHDVFATLRLLADAQLIRRHGRSRILASESVQVPFSFWLPARYFIVVPSALVLRHGDLRMAICHEAQHHRQQDTKLVYLHQLLEAAFFWNPAVHHLGRQLQQLQEFACDEAVGNRRDVSALEYGQCLLRVAEAAIRPPRPQVHASMISAGAGKVLKQRIEAILARPRRHLGRSRVTLAGAIALCLMATTAFAFTSTIRDRRVSAAEARRMAVVAQRGSVFPIVVNERVVRQLNLLLSTPDGLASLDASLGRMRGHEPFIAEQLTRHGMPLELLAVPLAEAGYRNLPQSDNPRQGAGLWMFIAPTARHFGLTVDAIRDERLDVAAETGAAIRMFTQLYLQFNDWSLALLAYNAGSARVEDAIRQTGSRDVWELIARGYENDSEYVARVMAVILILANPSAPASAAKPAGG